MKHKKDEIEKALKEALELLGTLYNDEHDHCRQELTEQGMIECKQDLIDFEDQWTSHSPHIETLCKVEKFFKKWKT